VPLPPTGNKMVAMATLNASNGLQNLYFLATYHKKQRSIDWLTYWSLTALPAQAGNIVTSISMLQ